jgi:DNA-binding MarR family transcriptional regulator
MEAAAAPKPRTAPRTGAAALATELRIAVMRATRRLRAEKADSDLSDSQLSVLALLEREGPRTPREIAAYERVQPPSMTRTLTALLDLGLVTRTEHPVDRRQVLVAVTETGAATVRETRRRRDAWLTRRLAALTPEERDLLARATQILRRIADS